MNKVFDLKALSQLTIYVGNSVIEWTVVFIHYSCDDDDADADGDGGADHVLNSCNPSHVFSVFGEAAIKILF